MMTQYVIICDIDNCYTDSRDWVKFAPLDVDEKDKSVFRERWDKFQTLSFLAKPNKSVIDFLLSISELTPIYFVTSREDRREARKDAEHQISKFSDGKIVIGDKHKLFMRKEFWRQNPFDTVACPGFHGYDLDICIQAYSKGYTNYVCGTCWIEHFSEGSFSKDWALTTLYLHQTKWKDTLPLGRLDSYLESRAYYVFLKNVSKLQWTESEKIFLRKNIPNKLRHPIIALKSLLAIL